MTYHTLRPGKQFQTYVSVHPLAVGVAMNLHVCCRRRVLCVTVGALATSVKTTGRRNCKTEKALRSWIKPISVRHPTAVLAVMSTNQKAAVTSTDKKADALVEWELSPAGGGGGYRPAFPLHKYKGTVEVS